MTEKTKSKIKKIVISLLIIMVTVGVDKIVQMVIHKEFYKIVEDDFSCVFQIDSVKEIDGKLMLDGWVFTLDENAKKKDFDIILYDYINDEEHYLKVEDKARVDVNEYFLCEYDYTESGFEASIKSEKLDLNNANYEVLIQPTEEINAYKSGIYITNFGIMYVRPEDYMPLEVVGTELEKIVNKGILRVYRPDVGMYVYQYEGKLYWIADKSYDFEADNITYIQYQLWTTQINNLPSNRLDNNHFWDNIGFYFEKKEISSIDFGNYRVTMSEVPREYSIVNILTGYHKESTWKWKQYFRPWYEFD